MSYPTFGELKDQVDREVDLQSEDFMGSQEMIDAFNEAVRECEAHIHKLGLEDIYFKSRALLSLTSGSAEVAFPSDIYAFKILKLIYAATNRVFTITRLRKDISLEELEDVRVNNSQSSTPAYQYTILNATAGSPKIYLSPPAQETSTTTVVCWYIRKANRMVDDDTICDIPAFESYIKKYVAWKAYFKEGHPNTPEAKNSLDEERNLMIQTLEGMVPDNDTVLEKDLSHYEEAN